MQQQVKNTIWQQLNLADIDGSGLLDDVFWYMDPEERTLHFSSSWQVLAGYDETTVCSFHDYLKITHPQDIARMGQAIRQFLRDEDSSGNLVLHHRIICRSGKICKVMLKIHRMNLEDGRTLLTGVISNRCHDAEMILRETALQTDDRGLTNRLREALLKNQFFMVYQPQYDVDSGQMNGMEALLRWQDGDRLVPPLEFIPAAEASGLMIPIGKWVLEEVCRQIVCWKQQGAALVPVAINISSTQFLVPRFLSDFKNLLNRTGVDPGLIELEITESVYMNTSKDVQLLLNKLRDLGVRIALDDFGAGYSSLTYIKHFKLDRLKIDRSFIQDIQDDTVDAAIINTIIMLAHILELSVVAEGVETKNQFDYLRQIGCNSVQGYYFSRPLNAEKLTRILHLAE